jgi:hypothetical protein
MSMRSTSISLADTPRQSTGDDVVGVGVAGEGLAGGVEHQVGVAARMASLSSVASKPVGGRPTRAPASRPTLSGL